MSEGSARIARMKKLPIKRNLPAPAREADEVVQPRFGEWLSFTYTHTEISLAGPKAKVRSARAQYADGRLTRDSFEGELGRDAGERMMRRAQELFLEQAALAMRAFGAFLPGAPRRGRKGD